MSEYGFKLYDIYDLKKLGKKNFYLLQFVSVFVKKNFKLFDIIF